ncbi:hypothetical protein EVG20_g4656 [Dentipellis fragilis]|uniref:Uncharacterized protein n=1 Tax=Dentipellis fragilis TaxID=205917 RepID=A0A4Y9YXY7_9AGAM|nr:hypothetical protein EVG20_g4656 [Dentipellis fragilis]
MRLHAAPSATGQSWLRISALACLGANSHQNILLTRLQPYTRPKHTHYSPSLSSASEGERKAFRAYLAASLSLFRCIGLPLQSSVHKNDWDQNIRASHRKNIAHPVKRSDNCPKLTYHLLIRIWCSCIYAQWSASCDALTALGRLLSTPFPASQDGSLLCLDICFVHLSTRLPRPSWIWSAMPPRSLVPSRLAIRYVMIGDRCDGYRGAACVVPGPVFAGELLTWWEGHRILGGPVSSHLRVLPGFKANSLTVGAALHSSALLDDYFCFL